MKGFRRGFFAAIASGAWALGLCNPVILGTEPAESDATATESVGPDIIVSSILGVIRFGYTQTAMGAVTGLAVGHVLCSVGTEGVQYAELPSRNHPVVRSSLYRLEEGRLEQIGISWVLHGFYASNDPMCNGSCTAPANHHGEVLYPGCAAPEAPQLAGARTYLGPTSQVNAHTGVITTPVLIPPSSSVINARLQVHNVDLDQALHPDARYYVEVHALTSDDAAAGNGYNNASHQQVLVINATKSPNDACSGNDPELYCLQMVPSISETHPAIRAWGNSDPDVVETAVQVPNEGLFLVAAKATDQGAGSWEYEYAVQNLNSDRSGGSFSIPLPYGVYAGSIGFHDVDYHSGEPYSGEDWASELIDHSIVWSTEDFSINSNANALRWGTLYNVRFVCKAPPGDTPATLGLFKPGTPGNVSLWTVGPAIDPDADGDFDLRDYRELLNCFSGSPNVEGFETPSAACKRNFDHDENYAVDLIDVSELRILSAGPS